jgi:hypothetical protein
MEATLSSDVNKIMPLLCIDKLNYFRLFQISAGYTTCCKQEKSEQDLVTNDLFKHRKKTRFFIQLKHLRNAVTTRHPMNVFM